MSWLVIFSASSIVLPMTSSVSAEDDAIADPQPNVWNCAFVMMFVSGSIFIISFSASPQEIAPTSPTALASTSTPAFFGLKKYSWTFSE